MSAGELIRALRAKGHQLRVAGGKVLVTPLADRELSQEEVDAIREHRGALYHVLAVAEIRGAMHRAVDLIAEQWPTRGPQPAPDLATVAAEAELDRALGATPLDSAAAHQAVKHWQACWVRVVQRHVRAHGGR